MKTKTALLGIFYILHRVVKKYLKTTLSSVFLRKISKFVHMTRMLTATDSDKARTNVYRKYM